ncbi:MAG: type II toxin-antitoxin system HicB family antitoxin [Verrucomicrobiales bacterium]
MKRYKAKDYEIRIWWSEEDDAFLAQVVDMPGLMTHGETPEDAARENYVALELALDCLREDGKTPPAPGSRRVHHASAAHAP